MTGATGLTVSGCQGFLCSDLSDCIKSVQTCNGKLACADGSDEMECDISTYKLLLFRNIDDSWSYTNRYLRFRKNLFCSQSWRKSPNRQVSKEPDCWNLRVFCFLGQNGTAASQSKANKQLKSCLKSCINKFDTGPIILLQSKTVKTLAFSNKTWCF